jgi:hypothetical protein
MHIRGRDFISDDQASAMVKLWLVIEIFMARLFDMRPAAMWPMGIVAQEPGLNGL